MLSCCLLQEMMRNPGAMDLDSLMQSAEFSMPESCLDGVSDDLTKLVLARRSRFAVRGRMHALHLLDILQQSNASSYQVALVLPCGTAFIASPPERLYLRDGRAVSSEAVAGTRQRGRQGDVEHDFYLGLQLLTAQKEHMEFSIVRDWVRDALASVCADVTVQTAKALLKQRTVQHLYSKITGVLLRGKNDADLLVRTRLRF
jgi:isochorismate synthase EntC